MNEERLMLLGQLAEAKRALRAIETQADGQVLLIRMRALSTLQLMDYKTDEIVAAATALHNLQAQAREQQALIGQITEALGVA